MEEREENLSQGYVIVYNMVSELFKGMDNVKISELDAENKAFTIVTKDIQTYNALRATMVIPEAYGEVHIMITCEADGENTFEKELEKVFADNKYFDRRSKTGLGTDCLLFKNTTIQFRTDDLRNPWGMTTYTPEQIMGILFTHKVHVTTTYDPGENVQPVQLTFDEDTSAHVE